MNYDNLALFQSIVEAGSITGAAKKLAMPKSKLSRRLAELEASFGTQLLQRTTRRLNLTQSGRLLFDTIQPHIYALSHSEHIIADYMTAPRGVVTILFPVEFFTQHIANIVMNFAQRFPEIELRCIQYSDKREYLGENIDLMFLLHERPIPPTDAVAKVLMSFPQAIFAHPDSEFSRITQFQRLAHIAMVGEHQNEVWHFRTQQQDVAISINNKYCFSSPEMRLTAAMSNMAIAKLPEYVVHDNKAQNKVVALSLNAPPVALQLSVMYQHRVLPLKTRAFLNFFQSEIGILTS